MKLVTSGLVPPKVPVVRSTLPNAFMKFGIFSPSTDVPIPVVVKSGAAVAPATLTGNGNGATTAVLAMRATTRARTEWELRVFNT